MEMEFGLPYYRTVSATTLQRHLADQERDLRGEVRQMELDMAMLNDDTFFKRWLRDQTHAADLAGLDMFDGFKRGKGSCPF